MPARATAVAQWARGMCYDVLVAGDQSVGCLPSAVVVVVGARIVTSAHPCASPDDPRSSAALAFAWVIADSWIRERVAESPRDDRAMRICG